MPPHTDQRSEQWQGAWITAAGSIPDTGKSGFHRAGFRTEFTVEALPESLPLRLTADSRYVLWVNGEEVGRGPVRAQPYRWSYDEYDITGNLQLGKNVVAVLVTYYGEDNALWQRAKVRDGLGSRASLTVDAPEAWSELRSGGHWQAQVQRAWGSIPVKDSINALPIESVDLRLADWGWLRADAAADWPGAERAVAPHPGGRDRHHPPLYPFGRLEARPIAYLDGEAVQATRVLSSLTAAAEAEDPVENVLKALDDLAISAADPEEHSNGALGQGPEADQVPPGQALFSLFDLKRITYGTVHLDFEAPAGSRVDVAYLERLPSTGMDRRYVPRSGVQLTAAGGRASFTGLEQSGLRFAAVLVTPSGAGTVQAHSAVVQERLYPFSGEASFSSSEKDLERLWEAGRRTVQLNSTDALTDCPTREQRAWVGDAVVHAGVHLVANEDWRLVARHLELCDSPRPDGILPMSVVGNFEASQSHTIPDWSLHWIHGLWLYARYSKDKQFISRRMATAERVLRWFEPYVTDGILQGVPEWTLGDWSSIFSSGKSAFLTALWARGLREFQELSQWLGNQAPSAWAGSRVQEVGAAFEAFWDPDRGLYVDHILDGEQQPAVSQVTNAAAVVADLVPQERLDGVVDRFIDEQRLVTRSWNAPSPTVSLEQKVEDRQRGILRIDWDPHHEIVRAEPFFSAVVHDAVARAGKAEMLPRLLRRWNRFLSDGYDTFGECWEWGTPAHGWSSTPTKDLITHVLGVTPAGLETSAYRVRPARTGIERLSAKVPTADGLLEVQLEGTDLLLESPVALEVITWDGDQLSLPPGKHAISMVSASDPSSAGTTETAFTHVAKD